MNPQPPVTRIRTAPDNSGGAGALADFPGLHAWWNQLANSAWTPWLILGLAAFVRFFLLGIKPPHFDEGINGWFVDQVMKTGFYRYDPTNYHGPLHFYVLLVSQNLFGRNLWALRLPVALVSIACVWLTLRFEPLVGRTASRMAALAMAVSPGFVFYGRYSIHEVWLVLFSMMFILGLLGLWRFGSRDYLWWAGLGLTGMILTKETYSIHIGCAAIAAIVCYISHRLNPLPDARRAKQDWDIVDLALVSSIGIGLLVFFYSGTFFHWSGVKGIFDAYAAWFKTGSEGHGHEKPLYYWLMLMTRYELPALAGLLVCAFCQRFKNLSLRYLAIYGVGTLIAYSIVHYKTPWCVISFVWPFFFTFGAALLLVPLRYSRATYMTFGVLASALLGVAFGCAIWWKFWQVWPFAMILGAVLLLIVLRYRAATYVTWALLLCASLGSMISLNYFRCTTDTEPYVYVQTYNDIFKLTRPLLTLAKRDPVNYHLTGHMIRNSSYPFPWILGDFPNIGYYEHGKVPTNLDADFLLVQEDRIAEVEPKLHGTYYTTPLRIRPYQDTSKVYLSVEKFKDFFPNRKPDFTGKGPG
jgi:uncharacterized protein (TIGR03663 family)